MIDFRRANKYCSEDLSLIENYEQAVNDKTQVWDCHHRKETDEGLSRVELIKIGLYWNRPASELIFMTKSEHNSLHKKGKPNPNKGKHRTEETRVKISAGMKGKNGKAVYQIHKITGIIIREWKCIRDVERVLGISQSNIVQCCKGKRKSTGGFKWQYVDEH